MTVFMATKRSRDRGEFSPSRLGIHLHPAATRNDLEVFTLLFLISALSFSKDLKSSTGAVGLTQFPDYFLMILTSPFMLESEIFGPPDPIWME